MSNDTGAATAVDSAAVFRRSWSLYQKFVTHNWMRHREVYVEFRKVVTQHSVRPLSIADFGCGDAARTMAALDGVPLERFIAIDRVRPLLDAARTALTSRGCQVELLEADLLAAAASPPQDTVDIVLAAYSLHHLSLADKQLWLSDVRRWASPEGRLVVIDLVSQRDESRRRYLDRFHRLSATHFRAFSDGEFETAREHIETYDFPETLATWSRLFTTAGWTTPRLAYRDPEELYAVLVSRVA